MTEPRKPVTDQVGELVSLCRVLTEKAEENADATKKLAASSRRQRAGLVVTAFFALLDIALSIIVAILVVHVVNVQDAQTCTNQRNDAFQIAEHAKVQGQIKGEQMKLRGSQKEIQGLTDITKGKSKAQIHAGLTLFNEGVDEVSAGNHQWIGASETYLHTLTTIHHTYRCNN